MLRQRKHRAPGILCGEKHVLVRGVRLPFVFILQMAN